MHAFLVAIVNNTINPKSFNDIFKWSTFFVDLVLIKFRQLRKKGDK